MTQRRIGDLKLEYLGEFAAVFEKTLRCEPLSLGETFDEKTRYSKIS
jgi:hypothetical protein